MRNGEINCLKCNPYKCQYNMVSCAVFCDIFRQSQLQAVCVASNTFGCEAPVKHSIESTFMSVKNIVHDKCTPPPDPEPSMQCTIEGKETRRCSVNLASQCMYEVYNDLTCDNPDFKKTCP
jgi:hypothetical protein